jgi:hypothetical protein
MLNESIVSGNKSAEIYWHADAPMNDHFLMLDVIPPSDPGGGCLGSCSEMLFDPPMDVIGLLVVR